MALGFVPLNCVQQGYRLLRNDPMTIRLLENLAPLGVIGDFLRYFENTWLNEHGSFPPQMWNVHIRPMEFRTNNHVESFHRRWNKAVNAQHPSLWVFMRVMKNEQRLHEITVRDALDGVPPPTRRRKWRRFEQRIVNLRTELHNNQRTIFEYWRAICHAVADFEWTKRFHTTDFYAYLLCLVPLKRYMPVGLYSEFYGILFLIVTYARFLLRNVIQNSTILRILIQCEKI